MNSTISRCFFSITLFLHICPSIFSKEFKPTAQHQFSQENIQQSNDLPEIKELFEELMLEARDQAKTIGFCIQQLLLKINAGNLKISSKKRKNVCDALLDIQNLTNVMLEQLFVQNSIEALSEGIFTNHVLISYLLDTLKTDITKIQASKIFDHLNKKRNFTISKELLFKLAATNHLNIIELEQVSEYIGLTWYNSTYRFLKKYNAYSIAKGTCILAAGTIVAGIILCKLNLADKIPFAGKYIGDSPESIENKPGYYKPVRSENGARIIDKVEMPDSTSIEIPRYTYLNDPTFIQSACMGLEGLTKIGLVATSAALTINYKDIFTSMYKDTYNWAHEKAIKKINSIDQNLQGTKKPNLNDDGQEKVYFKDMVGCQELELLAKKIANFMKHPEHYERAFIELQRGILLYGPPQTGKSLFAKALRTLIEDELGNDQKIHFINAKQVLDNNPRVSIEDIFSWASYYAPCIIFFDEIDLVGTHRDKAPITTSQLLTCMQGIDSASKQVIVIGATNRLEQLDKALLVDGRFGKKIRINYPKYEYRKTYLLQQLEKRCIQLDAEYVDYIAQETDGCSYNNLKRIITEAIILASIEKRQVTQQDFESALDTEVRHILPTRVMSEKERQIIATYQAGKATIRHVLHTAQEIVKITINPVAKEVKPTDAVCAIDLGSDKASDNEKMINNKKDQEVKLGEVFTKCSANYSELLSNKEQEKECMALLAGNVALQLIMGESFTQCNKQDRAEALQIIYNMISHGEKIDATIKAQALKIKEEYEQKIMLLLQENRQLLETISNKLLEQNTIDRYDWKKLIS